MIDKARALKITNTLLSIAAGTSSFLFSMAAFLTITTLDGQVIASLVAGLFCLMVCYIAAERPNSENARAMEQLGQRLLAVEQGDLDSPAPDLVKKAQPDVAHATEKLLAEVRASIDNAYALGMFDPVTSLPNRVQFRDEVERALQEAEEGDEGAMLFVDLDRFKRVNDMLGHHRGDDLLTLVAERLRNAVILQAQEMGVQRPLVARLAGDEFTVFIAGNGEEEQHHDLARRVAAAISEPYALDGHNIDIGASVGIARWPQAGRGTEQLMRAADLAMYRAKQAGGGRHVMYEPEMLAQYERNRDTEKALVKALRQSEFALVLQPQLSLQTGAITGAEALLRWHPAEGGVIKPASFIELAETGGLIGDIGEWVLNESAAILRQWDAQGKARRLSINISPSQLVRGDFFDVLRAIFAAKGVPLNLLELELTETAAMRCSRHQLEALAALRLEGVSVAIDDFGTGYSNIARLRTLPLDRIKIDPALTSEIEHSEQARNVTAAVVALIKSVGAEIVAEAIESAAMADILRTMGCDYVQGHVFAEPMAEREFFDWVGNAERGRSRVPPGVAAAG